ncbi:hypothetical protein C8Q77DRAFT_210017 [Trametes polyzona]|nr:hypothetical protein C8Q77DRAFT_210017 [Trametes polyzona]
MRENYLLINTICASGATYTMGHPFSVFRTLCVRTLLAPRRFECEGPHALAPLRARVWCSFGKSEELREEWSSPGSRPEGEDLEVRRLLRIFTVPCRVQKWSTDGGGSRGREPHVTPASYRELRGRARRGSFPCVRATLARGEYRFSTFDIECCNHACRSRPRNGGQRADTYSQSRGAAAMTLVPVNVRDRVAGRTRMAYRIPRSAPR